MFPEFENLTTQHYITTQHKTVEEKVIFNLWLYTEKKVKYFYITLLYVVHVVHTHVAHCTTVSMHIHIYEVVCIHGTFYILTSRPAGPTHQNFHEVKARAEPRITNVKICFNFKLRAKYTILCFSSLHTLSKSENEDLLRK